MKRFGMVGLLLGILLASGAGFAQKDKDEGPSSWLKFLVIKDENGKPVRNAAVIMHPVSTQGKQEQGGMELKTDSDGKADFNGIPYGMLRVQVLAQGFQTYGQDYDVDKPAMDFTIKLKRPQKQYSVYDNHPSDPKATQKQDSPQSGKKPN